MTAATASGELRDYLEVVRARLADLPPEEREHLLSDTEASLLAAAEEETPVPLELRFGAPERFADELRAAAGLAPAGAAPERPPRLRARLDAWLHSPGVVAALRLGRELAPAWWLARAYIVLAAAVILLRGPFSIRQPAIPVVLHGVLGTAVVFALLLAASIWLGRREHGRAAIALNLVVLAAALPVVNHLAERSVPVEYVEVGGYAAPPGQLMFDGVEVGNVYPYSRDGKLLHDVRLFDQRGHELDVRRQEADPSRRTLRNSAGEMLFNAFPIRYYDEGTRHVSNPEAGAPRRMPAIVTPPLHKRG